MNLGFEKVQVYFEGGDKPFQAGKVIVEPLEKGFAITLGNALRRIMLRHLPGAAAVGVKLPGVFHEFCNIEGASTDMTELILNIKKIRFKSQSEEIETVRFEKKEAGFYTAGDLILPNGVEVQNPQQELIAINGEKNMEFEIYVKVSRGYVNSSYSSDFEDRPDIIPIDGIFSPIRLVEYKDEQMRIGQNANFERLVLNVTTDGSAHPKDAVMLAAKILNAHSIFFEDMPDLAEKVDVFQEKKEEENRILDLTIDHLDLKARAYNCLNREQIRTVKQIMALTEHQLYSIPQMGEKSVKEVIQKIKELGLEFRKE